MNKKLGTRGNGSITFSAIRNCYIVRVPVGKHSNGRTRFVSRNCKTRIEADKVRRELLNRRDNKQLAAGPRQTFEQFAMRYLEFDAPNVCKQTTINDYYGHFRRYLFPHIGKIPIADITSMQLEELLTSLRKKHSAKTVNTIRGVLGSVFTSAERHELVITSPVRRTKPAKQGEWDVPRNQPPWSVEECQAVMACDPGSLMNIYITLSLMTGLRIGEVLGLQWDDIDLDSGLLYVQRTLRQTTEFTFDGQTKTALVFNTPKTKDSQRFLQIHRDTLDSLRLLKLNQDMNKQVLGDEWVNSGCVFTETNGRCIYPETMRSRYRKFLEKNNARYIRPHDLRHTFATILIENGASLQQVQQAMGQSSIEMTKNVYGKNLPVLGQQATALQAQILKPKGQILEPIEFPKKVDMSQRKVLKGGRRPTYG